MKKAKPYSKMTLQELQDATKQFDNEIPLSRTRPVSAEERRKFRQMQRQTLRHRKSRQSKPTKPYSMMTTQELAEATKEFDRLISPKETRSPSSKGKALWDKARQAKRPKNVRIVLIALNKDLLAKTDSLAKHRKLSRSEFVARTLRKALTSTE